jgi:hypothetical protein
LAGVFVLGVGLGVTVDSQVNTNPKDLASRDAIDNAAPNPTLCAKLGASAMAFDERVFVTFNPFNIYVSQADVKPACVLLEANVVPTLRDQGLITDKEGEFVPKGSTPLTARSVITSPLSLPLFTSPLVQTKYEYLGFCGKPRRHAPAELRLQVTRRAK